MELLTTAFKVLRRQFNPPETKLRALRQELEYLCGSLERLIRIAEGDPLTSVTNFFIITSPWFDRDDISNVIEAYKLVNDGRYDSVLKRLRLLDYHIQHAGRNMYGMNRTIKGEDVTPEKIYLGNIFGLSTQPVPFWQQRRDGKALHGIGFAGKQTAYELVSAQALAFIQLHAPPMLENARQLSQS